MLTVALALLAFVLAVACGVVWRLWREASVTVAEQAGLIRHQRGQIDNLCAELDALSIAPPAAVAALQPDAEPSVPAGWLADLHKLPTTYDREYPR